MYDDEYKIVIASILHDIGKIGQRFNIKQKHAELGYEFINNNAGIIDVEAKKDIADLVRYHHTDTSKTGFSDHLSYLLEILKTADHKSAAHDREDKDESFKDVKLEKISDLISLDGENDRSSNFYSLSTLDNIEDLSLNTGYQTIWKVITNDIKNINFNQSPYNIFNDLNTILFKDTIFVPSAFYYSNPNISLYHHLKLTAAIALSIYRHNKYKNIKTMEENDPKFILLMCNLSGIQSYIFRYFKSESADEKGTKRLKGRSFMIKLFTDSIEVKLMKDLNLYRFNIVWEKSDGFMMLFENTEENKNKLEILKREISEGLLDKRRGISATISWVDASLQDFATINNHNQVNGDKDYFGIKMQELYNELDKNKFSNFNDIIADLDYENKFNYNIENVCETCGLDNAYKDNKCKGCLEEEYIGTELYRNNYLIMSENDDNGKIQFKYGKTKLYYHFSNAIDKNSENIKIKGFEITKNEANSNLRFLFQAKYAVTTEYGSIKPINDLFNEKDEHKMLAVLKGDVDNMGMVIAAGFNNLTISRLASLSFEFEYFFSVKLDNIAEKSEVYVIYSGGDDLTVIGRAEKIINFIGNFKKEFDKYFSNKNITLSAGITINDPKFPLRRSILNAEDNLEKAKMNSKDSITFLNTMKWEEYQNMEKLGNFLFEKACKNIISQSFIYLLNRLGKQTNINISKGTVITTQIGSQSEAIYPDPIVYYYVERNVKNKEKFEEAKEIKEKFLNNENIWKYMDFITSYAVIKYREHKNYGGNKNEFI